MIEESVLQRVWEAGLAESAAWQQMERGDQVAALRAAIERVGYNGNSQRISIRFHRKLPVTAGQGARA